MNNDVTGYISEAPSEQKIIMQSIRKIVHDSVPGATEEFKWGRPVFRTSKDFAYLKIAKAYVTLGFFNFSKLRDPKNLLEGTGKDMRHIKIKKAADLDTAQLTEWFRTSAS